jgi:hypothetical protein
MNSNNGTPARPIFLKEGISRRAAIGHLGGGSAMLLVLGAGGCSTEAGSSPGPRNDGDDDALFARLMKDAEPRVPRRETPYRLTRTVHIPAGRTVTLEPGTRILWAGTTQPKDDSIGVFEAGGDDIALICEGGEATVECPAPSPRVYAALMRGRRGFRVAGIQSRECQHVHVGSTAPDYASVRTGPNGNVARDIRITGGGARYAELQTKGQGACLVAYAENCRVEGSRYENVSHGVQWWGGDSGLEPWQNGARANERKCTNLVIERVSVRHAIGGGIWGSMGSRVVVRDCSVEGCRDVGFDAEGCVDTTFERCRALDCLNGCFATFALCDGVRFVDCFASVGNHRRPLFRTYNVTQSPVDNRLIEVVGGRFECRDRSAPGTMDTAMGPARSFIIRDAELINVRIDTAFFNMHRTSIVNNTLIFPYLLPSVAAIRAGSSRRVDGDPSTPPGGAVVQGNRIRYTAGLSSTNPVAIEIYEDDYNSAAASEIVGNVVEGPFARGIVVVNATLNSGITPTFEIAGNNFSGLPRAARLLSVTRKGAQAPRPNVRWDANQARDGKATALDAALR